jgi:ParB-like chromosome segregation protein Spo0J
VSKPNKYTSRDIELIDVEPNPLRPVNDEEVKRLAVSMQRIGLMTPVTVRLIEDEEIDRWVLIAGRHRLAAAKSLGWARIDVIEVQWTDIEARLWEISENLHRADLTQLQRKEQIAEWIRLTDEKNNNCRNAAVIKRGPGQPEGGLSAAAREIGVKRTSAQEAIKVASLSDEAKVAAVEHGLDDNKTALLEAAKETDPKAQVKKIVERATKKPDDPLNNIEIVDKQVRALMLAWNKAGVEAREKFLARIDQPIMDKRYGQ